MLGLVIEFLTGRYVATAHNDRRATEWPPHPARVFSALVATHFDEPEPDPRERAALEWLERLGPPVLHCTEATEREIYDVFVPVNDGSIVADFSGDMAAISLAQDEISAAGADTKKAAKAQKQLEKLQAKLHAKVAKEIAPIIGKIPADTLKLGVATLPAQRIKQARTFPSVSPHEPRVALVWPDAPDLDQHRDALDALAARVVRVGHSSSLVAMRVVDQVVTAPPPFLVPDPDGTQLLRGVVAGQMARLCEDFAVHQGAVSGRTMPAAMLSYAKPATPVDQCPSSIFGDDWIVFLRDRRTAGDARAALLLDTTRAVDVAKAVRNALQSYSPVQPPPEFVSGHKPEGAPSESPHLAIVPLPSIGHGHADGHLVGVALVFPRGVSGEDRRAVLRAIDAWEHSDKAVRTPAHVTVPILLPHGLEFRVERALAPGLSTAKPGYWSRAARQWATATPIALDRHPGDLRSRDPAVAAAAAESAAKTIADACVRIGLPTPHVEVLPAAPLAGARKAQHFPAYPPVQGRTRRALTHARLTFDEPVAGPILLGAGRYHGLGLLIPLGLPGDAQ